MRIRLSFYSLLVTFYLASCASNAETGAIATASRKEEGLIGLSEAPEPSVNGSAYLDSREQKNMRFSPRTLQRIDRGEPLTIDDIIKLHGARVEDQTVISYIQESRATYSLTETQMRRLRSAGVSPEIIAVMRREES